MEFRLPSRGFKNGHEQSGRCVFPRYDSMHASRKLTGTSLSRLCAFLSEAGAWACARGLSGVFLPSAGRVWFLFRKTFLIKKLAAPAPRTRTQVGAPVIRPGVFYIDGGKARKRDEEGGAPTEATGPRIKSFTALTIFHNFPVFWKTRALRRRSDPDKRLGNLCAHKSDAAARTDQTRTSRCSRLFSGETLLHCRPSGFF